MTTKSPRKASKRKSKPIIVERRTLNPKPLRVDLRAEPLARPAVSRGLFRRPEIAKRLTLAEIRTLVTKTGMKPMGGGGQAEIHVELSPAIPWVDGLGWLTAAGTLQSWFATTTIGFYPDKPNQEQGIFEIWMDGLTEGDAYLAQIRVGGWSANPQVPGTFNIGASDASHADIHHSGASQTLSVLIPAVGGPMSLITIETKGLGGWYFDDVLVTHVGTLG